MHSDARTAYQQRQEIPFLDHNKNVMRLKGRDDITRLRNLLLGCREETGVEYVLGEWYKRIGGPKPIVIGHGVYDLQTARLTEEKYGNTAAEFHFGFWRSGQLEEKLAPKR